MQHSALKFGFISLFGVALHGPVLAQDFMLNSHDIAPGAKLKNEQVMNGYGCAGGNIAPELNWSGAPAATRSYGLTVYDPDAPTGSGWWHWLVINIPAEVTALPAGSGQSPGTPLPAGALQTRTDFGRPGFGGACPPKGAAPHRYLFTLYALDTPHLDLEADASAAHVSFMLRAHALASATLTASYTR
jgi:Raf kinase inhibitor-like YbhB/YbcL family protein